MHEENIQYIRQYLRENAQFPIEQLIETLQSAGYHAEDIMAARAPEIEEETADSDVPVESLGSEHFSQQVVNDPPSQKAVPASISVGTSQPRAGSRFSRTSFLWWGAGLLGVAAMASAAYVFISARAPASNEDMIAQEAPSMENQTSETAQTEQKMDEKEVSAGDILVPFRTSFYQRDFKVSVRGTDAATPDILKEYTVYIRKGEVVRAEFASVPNKVSIMKNNKVFEIDTAKKEFHEYPAGTGQAKEISDRAIADIDTLDMLTEQSFSGDIDWSVRPGLTYVNSADEGAETIRVTLDPSDQMVTGIATRSSQDATWHTVSFTFTPVSDIDTLMRFPLDYKKLDSSAMGA